jgi:hypothetical protein
MRVRPNRFVSMPGSRGWGAFCVIGIAAWVGATVLAGVLNDDPSDGRPVLLTFAAGGAIFFGIVFGVALWQTRTQDDPELDALLEELALEPVAGGGRAAAIGGMRRVARAYILLGIIVTFLGLAAIVQEGLEFGSPRGTLYAMVAIVVAWAAAVPLVIRYANRASAAVLGPLGLEQVGATLSGERHGRQVSISLTPKGSTTRVEGAGDIAPLAGDAILAWAGRGNSATWDGASVDSRDGRITVRRSGQRGPAWLWDLWLAERLAGE